MSSPEPIGIRLAEPLFEPRYIALVTLGVPGYDTGAYRLTWLEVDTLEPNSHITLDTLRDVLRVAFGDGQTVIRDVRGIARELVELELAMWRAEREESMKL